MESRYWLTRLCFQRSLAFIYFIAYAIALNQFRPLVGEKGLLPVRLFLQRVGFWDAPSVFWLNHSDLAFAIGAWVGIALSLFALSGLSESYGLAVSMGTWTFLWALYLSFVSVGQTFYGFGWESLLCETGFLAIFLGHSRMEPPVIVIWLLRWLLFRVMFGAGLIKLRGDPCWRDLTCMQYHYETQPLPNPLSWYLHRLPLGMHKLEVLFTHLVELPVPFFYFFPGIVGSLAGLITILFQGTLILSGNLSWLNYITIVIAISCFDDAFLSRLVPLKAPALLPAPGVAQGAAYALTGIIALLSIRPTLNLISDTQIMNTSFDPLRLVNTYGAFGSITRERDEVIVEGTEDPVITSATKWKEYEFKGKPGDPARAPVIVSPYHYKIDWQMWFAAMTQYWRHPWFVNFVAKLLQNDAPTLSLLAKNPFPETPPRYVRAELFRYRFTEPGDPSGNWWKRERLGSYFPPVSLDDPEFRRVLENQGWL